jgi:hypothetical protein
MKMISYHLFLASQSYQITIIVAITVVIIEFAISGIRTGIKNS